LEWHSCWRLNGRPSVDIQVLLEPEILSGSLAKPRISWDRTAAGTVPMLIACGARQEKHYHPKAIAPAASTNAIPKGASPSRECALRTTAAGGPSLWP